MIKIINKSKIVKNEQVYDEVNAIFHICHSFVRTLADSFDLHIHYVDETIKFKSRGRIFPTLNLEDSSGLFISMNLFANRGLDIYILVEGNTSDDIYQRKFTLTHEIGHFVDFVIGVTIYDSTKHEFMSAYNSSFQKHQDDMSILIRLNREDDYDYYTDSIHEQFAEYFGYKCFNSVPREYQLKFNEFNKELNDLLEKTMLIRSGMEKTKLIERIQNEVNNIVFNIKYIFKKIFVF